MLSTSRKYKTYVKTKQNNNNKRVSDDCENGKYKLTNGKIYSPSVIASSCIQEVVMREENLPLWSCGILLEDATEVDLLVI